MFLHSRTYWALLSALVLLMVIPVAFGAGYFQLPKLVLLGLGVTLSGISAFLNRGRLQATLPSPVLYLLLAYLFWILLTNTVWSSAPSYTLLGWREWYGGFFMQSLFVMVVILASLQPRTSSASVTSITRDSSPVWLYVFLILSVLLAVTATLELLGFNPILGSSWFRWNGAGISAPDSGQPVATVGNSGWFAGVWLLLTPLPMLLRDRSPVTGFFWQLIIAVGVSVVHSKITMAAYIAFQVGLLAHIYLSRPRRSHHFALPIICVAISLLAFPLAIKSNEALFKSGMVKRLSTAHLLSDTQDNSSFTARLTNYKVALRLISERPIAGWGSETFHERFFDKLDPSEYRKYIANVVKLKTDENVRHYGEMHVVTKKNMPGTIKSLTYFEVAKPHNFALEEAYNNGLVGLALLSTSIVLIFIRGIGSKVASCNIFLSAVFIYGIYLMLWFTTVAITPIACVLLAFAARSAAESTESSPN